MNSQDRQDLDRPLAFHDQRAASTLLAEQYSDSLTAAPSSFPDRKDVARCDATAGAFNVPLPLGTDDNKGLPFTVLKTDSGANAAGLVCSGSQTFPDSSTTLTTAIQGGRVTAAWDGTYWRNVMPGSGASSPTLAVATSLTIGDGTASPALTMNKSDAGTIAIDLKRGSTLRGKLSLDASENVALAQYDGSGVELGKLSFSNSSGAATLSKALTITTGGLTISAGGATVTAGGLTVTAGGAVITAGGLQVNGGLTKLTLTNYADDTAAGVGGLVAGELYRTAGAVMVKL